MNLSIGLLTSPVSTPSSSIAPNATYTTANATSTSLTTISPEAFSSSNIVLYASVSVMGLIVLVIIIVVSIKKCGSTCCGPRKLPSPRRSGMSMKSRKTEKRQNSIDFLQNFKQQKLEQKGLKKIWSSMASRRESTSRRDIGRNSIVGIGKKVNRETSHKKKNSLTTNRTFHDYLIDDKSQNHGNDTLAKSGRPGRVMGVHREITEWTLSADENARMRECENAMPGVEPAKSAAAETEDATRLAALQKDATLAAAVPKENATRAAGRPKKGVDGVEEPEGDVPSDVDEETASWSSSEEDYPDVHRGFLQ